MVALFCTALTMSFRICLPDVVALLRNNLLASIPLQLQRRGRIGLTTDTPFLHISSVESSTYPDCKPFSTVAHETYNLVTP
jgi:hypothetical protein